MLFKILESLGFADDDFVLADDGAGPYIAAWHSAHPQPTPEQIEAAAKPAALAAITEQIKAERDRRKELGVPVGPYRFHSDSASRIQQLALVMLGANMPADLVWRTMGGVNAPMTPTLAGQVFGATVQRDGALFAVADAHIAAAAAGDDPLAYDFSAGWPA